MAIQVVPQDLMDKLKESSQEMIKRWEHSEPDPHRNTPSTILGYWRPYRLRMAPSKPSLGVVEREWLKQQQPLFDFVSSLLAVSVPSAHERLKEQAVKLFPPFRLGVYPTIAFNQSGCSEHIDFHDLPEVRCGVLPWGRYGKGGALRMPELGLRLDLREGDVAFFQSNVRCAFASSACVCVCVLSSS